MFLCSINHQSAALGNHHLLHRNFVLGDSSSEFNQTSKNKRQLTFDIGDISLEFIETSNNKRQLTLDAGGTSSKFIQTRRVKNTNNKPFDLEANNPKPIGGNLFMFDLEANNHKPIGGKLVTFNLASKYLVVNKNNPRPIGHDSPDNIDGQKVPDNNDGQHKISSKKREHSLVSQLIKRNELNVEEENRSKVQPNKIFRKATALWKATTIFSCERNEPGTESSDSNRVTQFQDITLHRTNHTDREGEKELNKKKVSLLDEQATSYYSLLKARHKFQTIVTIAAAASDSFIIVQLRFQYRVNRFHRRFVLQRKKVSLSVCSYEFGYYIQATDHYSKPVCFLD